MTKLPSPLLYVSIHPGLSACSLVCHSPQLLNFHAHKLKLADKSLPPCGGKRVSIPDPKPTQSAGYLQWEGDMFYWKRCDRWGLRMRLLKYCHPLNFGGFSTLVIQVLYLPNHSSIQTNACWWPVISISRIAWRREWYKLCIYDETSTSSHHKCNLGPKWGFSAGVVTW